MGEPYAPQPTPTPPPVPSPPTYDPAVYPQQFSVPPVSGYGYGMPTSVMPAPPPPPRRTGTIVLSVLASLLLVATGVMSTLYVLQRSETNKSNDKVTTLSAESTSRQTKIDSLQKDLETSQRDLSDARTDNEELASHKKTLGDCLTAIDTWLSALADAKGVQTADVKKKAADVQPKCEAAFKLI